MGGSGPTALHRERNGGSRVVERRTRRTDRTCLTSHTGHSPASPGDRATARRQPRRRGGLAFPPSFLLSHGDAHSTVNETAQNVARGARPTPATRGDEGLSLWSGLPFGPRPTIPPGRLLFRPNSRQTTRRKKRKEKEWIRRPKRGRSGGLMVGGPLLSRAYYSMKFSNSNSLILSLVKHTNPT